MPLKLVVPNGLFGLLVLFVVLFSVAGVFAYTFQLGTVPNPGHALSTIQGYFSGDANLQQSLGKFCQSDGTGCLGDITGVVAGNGLVGGGASGTVDLNVNTGIAATTGLEIVSDEVRLLTAGCVAGEVLKRNASNNGWGCVVDAVGVGTITGVTAGTGLSGGGTTGNVTLNLNVPTAAVIGGVKSKACAAGQAVTGIDTAGNPVCGAVVVTVPPGQWFPIPQGSQSCLSYCKSIGRVSQGDPNTLTSRPMPAMCKDPLPGDYEVFWNTLWRCNTWSVHNYQTISCYCVDI